MRSPSHLDPARCDADLVVAQHVVGDAIAVGAAVRPRILQRRREFALHHHVERDRGVFGRVEPDPDRLQRFDHLVVDRPHRGARRIRRQPSAGADGPLLGTPADTRPLRRRHRGWCTCRRRAQPAASCPAHARWSRSSRSRTDRTDSPSRTCPRSGESAARPREPVPRSSSTARRSSSQRPLPAVGGAPKNAVISVPRSYSRIQVSAHSRQWLLGRIVIRCLRKCQAPNHFRQMTGRHGVEHRGRASVPGTPARSTRPAELELVDQQRRRHQFPRRGAAVLERDVFVECRGDLRRQIADVPDRLPDVFDAIPRIRRQMAVQDQTRNCGARSPPRSATPSVTPPAGRRRRTMRRDCRGRP